MSTSAYNFKELERSGQEGVRLSAQARAFVDLELPWLLRRLPSQASIADFGCGTGVISHAIAVNLPDAQVIGLDPDDRALELANAKREGVSNLSFQRFGFGESGGPGGGSFDVAFTRLVLLHLRDPLQAIKDMAHSLKPGGLLYLVDCDDDYVNFAPKELWQEELLCIMKEAQSLRGGTRTLGSKLLSLVEKAGLWPEGQQVLYYSTDELGLERWKEIFVPAMGNMAQRDLDFLSDQGRLTQEKKAKIQADMRSYFDSTGIRVQLSAWHAWGRKI